MFCSECGIAIESNGDPLNCVADGKSKLYFPATHTHQHSATNKPVNPKIIAISGFIIVMTILIGVLIVTGSTLVLSKNKNENMEEEHYIPTKVPTDQSTAVDSFSLRLVSRASWLAKQSTAQLVKLNLPLHKVIILETASRRCEGLGECAKLIQLIQNLHMRLNHWDDIGYNFMVDTEGLVYVGRGWYQQGAHTKGYNVDSLGVALIGTYNTMKPSEKQFVATQNLIKEGVRLGVITSNYSLYGARQLGSSAFNIIRTWKQWSKGP